MATSTIVAMIIMMVRAEMAVARKIRTDELFMALFSIATCVILKQMFAKKVGIDLGTVNTRIYVPRHGVVVDEPSVVALDVNSSDVVAIGKAAEDMLGRTPEAIELYRPLIDGVIADFGVTQTMLRHFLGLAIGRIHLVKPD